MRADHFASALLLVPLLIVPMISAAEPSHPVTIYGPDEPPHDAAKRDEALALSKKAAARALAHDYVSAIALYSDAIDRWWASENAILPALSFALAVSYDRVGRSLDALAYVHAYLREGDTDKAKAALARSMLQRLLKTTGHIAIDNRTAPSARITVDGRPIYSFDTLAVDGGTIFVEDVEPGQHEIAVLSTYASTGRPMQSAASVTVRVGETVTAVFTDKPVAHVPTIDARVPAAVPDRDSRLAVEFANLSFLEGVKLLRQLSGGVIEE